MFARVRTFNAPTERIDESVQGFRDSFLPRIRQLDGYASPCSSTASGAGS